MCERFQDKRVLGSLRLIHRPSPGLNCRPQSVYTPLGLECSQGLLGVGDIVVEGHLQTDKHDYHCRINTLAHGFHLSVSRVI